MFEKVHICLLLTIVSVPVSSRLSFNSTVKLLFMLTHVPTLSPSHPFPKYLQSGVDDTVLVLFIPYVCFFPQHILFRTHYLSKYYYQYHGITQLSPLKGHILVFHGHHLS